MIRFIHLLIFFLYIIPLHSLVSLNTVWRDTKGNPISCHGGGFLKIQGRWWWYGESRKDEVGISQGVNAYSAPSLNGPWRFEGQVLTSSDFALLVGEIDAGSSIVVERPKVVYAPATGQYVLWCHLDISENTAVDSWANYVFRRAGVAVAASPSGPFKPIRALRPNGLESLDINLFTEGDTTYVIRACTKNQFLGITKLTSDKTNTEGQIISTLKAKVEGPVLFRDPSSKDMYIIASGVHGWEPGRMFAFRGRGSSIAGMVWDPIDLNPTLHPKSFFSQPTAVLTEYSSFNKKPFLVYVGDNWVFGQPHDGKQVMSEMNTPPAGRFTERYKEYIGKLLTWEHTRLPYASYVMLPLYFDKSNNPRIEYQPVWTVDKPFADVAVFGCVSGVASLQPDGRHTCMSRTCPHLQSAVVGLPFFSEEDSLGAPPPASSSSSLPSGGVVGMSGSGVAYFGGGRMKTGPTAAQRGSVYVPQALKKRSPYGNQRHLLRGGDDEYMESPSSIELTEEQKVAKNECDMSKVLEKGKLCREADQAGCILPRLSWDDILSGKAQSLGESGEGVTHGNYKWKNMGATMWKAKQKGKDPKFWKKTTGEE